MLVSEKAYFAAIASISTCDSKLLDIHWFHNGFKGLYHLQRLFERMLHPRQIWIPLPVHAWIEMKCHVLPRDTNNQRTSNNSNNSIFLKQPLFFLDGFLFITYIVLGKL